MEGLDFSRIREQFPILKREVNGYPLIYFDNAATMQKPQAVIDSISNFYINHNANIHRGVHMLAEEATELWAAAHRAAAQFINASSFEEIIFLRNSTEALNLIVNSYAANNLQDGDIVVLTEMEHHSNIVPWQLLQKRIKFQIEWIPVSVEKENFKSTNKSPISESRSNIGSFQSGVNKIITDLEPGLNYTLDLNYLEKLLQENGDKVKIISLVHQSNVLDITVDFKKIKNLIRNYSSKSAAKVSNELKEAKGQFNENIISPSKKNSIEKVSIITILDVSQSITHTKIDVQDLGADFLMFSGHKLYGPTGSGVLYGKKDLLENMEPWMGGGEMISSVNKESSEWNSLPWKFEAGTPDIAAGVGLHAAIEWFERELLPAEDYTVLQTYLRSLIQKALDGLVQIPQIKVLGTLNPSERNSLIAFTYEGIHSHDVASMLNEYGIAVRAGYHCAQPLHDKLNLGTTTRISFAPYNTGYEVDKLITALKEIGNKFK